MASVTRSTRRGELSLHPSPQQEQQKRKKLQQHDGAAAPASMHPRTTAVLHQATNGGGGAGGRTGRTNKRGLEDGDVEAVKHKRSRFSVDILAKPRVISHAADKAAPTTGPAVKPTTTTITPDRTSTSPNVAATVAKSESTTIDEQTDALQNNNATSGLTADSKKDAQNNSTKKGGKGVNGMKHELDRLQPKAADTKQEGRKLRSQEATKFKSELAAYFPDYDEVIGNEQKQQHLLNIDTPIIITDTSVFTNGAPPHSNNATYSPHLQPFDATTLTTPRGYGDELFTSVWGAQVIDLSFLEPQLKLQSPDDPLPDSLFMPVHKRAERLERSIRNTEKGRAQHEKDRIIHLLEGLQGHDWLRVMGVSGVTETKKKEFQPARQHFMKGCQGILDKFRNWTLEERRRKAEKARALAEQRGEDSSDSASEEESEEEEEAGEDGSSAGGVSETSSPAKQLREEAMARSKLSKKKPRGGKRLLPPPKPPGPPKEFKSFFSKKHERDAALAPRPRSHTRRGGRTVLAWGQPIPEIEEFDFMLPLEYRDEETLRTRARKKRREKRNSTQ